MIQIDGSLGEGGGQVLRSSLTLSLLTKYDFQITNIRSRRSNPGLRAQPLKAVKAAASVGRAGVQGAELGSTALSFHPEAIHPGRYSLEISTAGAASLVLQTIFLPLALAGAGSTITITGGTHVNWSPPYHYLELQWLPFMRRIGFNADLKLQLAGFYPEGGGHMTAAIPPNSAISPLHITARRR